jgi:hypothetical protein
VRGEVDTLKIRITDSEYEVTYGYSRIIMAHMNRILMGLDGFVRIQMVCIPFCGVLACCRHSLSGKNTILQK